MNRTRKADKAAKAQYDQVCYAIDLLKGNFPWLGTSPVSRLPLAVELNALYHGLQVRKRYAEDMGQVRPRRTTGVDNAQG